MFDTKFVAAVTLILADANNAAATPSGLRQRTLYHDEVEVDDLVCEEATTEPTAGPTAGPTITDNCFNDMWELMDAIYYYNQTTFPNEYQLTIDRYGPISDWCVDKVEDFSHVFMGSTINEDISKWNTARATKMNEMFKNAVNFNQDISNWDVSSVTTMRAMFSEAPAFDQDLSLWEVAKVEDMSEMFYAASSFNQDLSLWDVSSVKTMTAMFRWSGSFNQDLCSWSLSDDVSMDVMFTNTGCEVQSEANAQSMCKMCQTPATSMNASNDCSGCNGECVVIDLSLTTDTWGEETGLSLENFATGETFWNVSALELSAFTTYDYTYNVCKTGCYLFTLTDTYGDGLICNEGGYTLQFDGEIVLECITDAFSNLLEVNVGNGCN